jgi:hypothetical protein
MKLLVIIHLKNKKINSKIVAVVISGDASNFNELNFSPHQNSSGRNSQNSSTIKHFFYIMLVQKPLKYFWIGTNNEIISFENSRNLIMRHFFKLLNLYIFRRIKNNGNVKGIRYFFLSFKNSTFKLLQVCNSEQATNFRF